MGAFLYKKFEFFVDMGFSISNSINFYQFESLHVYINLDASFIVHWPLLFSQINLSSWYGILPKEYL